jgi:hypothetical protein
VVLAASLTVVALAGTPAHANWECNYGYVCVYEFQFGGGASYFWGPNSPSSGCVNLGGFWNDQVDSIRNRRSDGKQITFYRDAGCNPFVVSQLTFVPANGANVTLIPPKTNYYSSYLVG